MKEKELINESIALLRNMVAVPSPTFGEGDVSMLISGFLTEKGIGNTRIKNNIVALNKGFDPAKESLMLNAHIDTVPPADGYSFDPYMPAKDDVMKFTATLADERPLSGEDIICGLGSNDDGGCVAALVAVFRHFHNATLPCNLILVLSAEEERSGADGMAYIWEHFNDIPGLENARRPAWAIVGEPTRMKAATSERGLLVIDGTAAGVSGHAARGEGVNALYIAIEDILKLKNHCFEKVSPAMGKVHLSVTQIEGGTAHNIIPDKCTFTVDIRPTDKYDNQEILSELQAMCKSRLTARNLKNKSSATYPDSPLAAAARASGIEEFSSPTTSDWIRIGCDAVKMGPGDSGRSHRKDEYILRSEIEEGVGRYISFIGNFTNYL